MTEPTQALVDFTLKTTFDDLPGPVVKQGKRLLLDAIGCALAARVTEKARIVKDFVEAQGGNDRATVVGQHRTSYALAAFANGELINALDYDAMGPITGHITPYVTPPCLAMAEKGGASGKDLLTAMVMAHEVGGRILSSMAQRRVSIPEPPFYEDAPRYGFSPTVFGGVVGACKLLKLGGETTANALGIAGASTPVPASQKWEQTSRSGFMVKYNCWAGWIAQLATVSTLLAEKGFTGDTTILDGDWGFWKIVGSPFFEPDRLIGQLGKTWHLDTLTFKPYPCCTGNQAGIDVINKIMDEDKLAPEDIQAVVVKGALGLLCPCRAGTEVKLPIDAQFLNAYIFALAVYRGRRPSPDWQSADAINHPGIQKLMKKVSVELHPRCEELATKSIKEKQPAFRDVVVEITAGGKKHSGQAGYQKGSPQNPLTDEELQDKFRKNASYSLLKGPLVEGIITAIDKLEDMTDVRELARLLVPNPS